MQIFEPPKEVLPTPTVASPNLAYWTPGPPAGLDDIIFFPVTGAKLRKIFGPLKMAKNTHFDLFFGFLEQNSQKKPSFPPRREEPEGNSFPVGGSPLGVLPFQFGVQMVHFLPGCNNLIGPLVPGPKYLYLEPWGGPLQQCMMVRRLFFDVV